MAGPGAGGGPSLTILIAPDSFKGSLSSVEVAHALADGWSRARPRDRIVLRRSPTAARARSTRSRRRAAGRGRKPSRTIRSAARSAPAGCSRADGRRAVVELAAASGLSRVAPLERDAVAATLGRDRASSSGRRSTPAPGRSCSASAAAPRPTAAPGCSRALGATADRDGPIGRPRRARSAARRRRARDRLRRHEPAPRADRARPPSTVRRRGRRRPMSPSWTPPGRLRRCPRGGHREPRPRDPRGRARPGGVGFALLAIRDRFLASRSGRASSS